MKAHELARLLLAGPGDEVIVENGDALRESPMEITTDTMLVDEEEYERACEAEEDDDAAWANCVVIRTSSQM
jgi:hypothetical protein